MNKSRILRDTAIFIKSVEGYREVAYLDSGDKYTYGIGFTVTPRGFPVQKGMHISEKESEEFLIKLLEDSFVELQKLIKVPICDNQFCALLSFVYNVGITAFRRSQLLSKINKQYPEVEITNEFLKWVYCAGRYVKGLENRRRKEIQLYFKKNTASLPL